MLMRNVVSETSGRAWELRLLDTIKHHSTLQTCSTLGQECPGYRCGVKWSVVDVDKKIAQTSNGRSVQPLNFSFFFKYYDL